MLNGRMMEGATASGGETGAGLCGGKLKSFDDGRPPMMLEWTDMVTVVVCDCSSKRRRWGEFEMSWRRWKVFRAGEGGWMLVEVGDLLVTQVSGLSRHQSVIQSVPLDRPDAVRRRINGQTE